MTRPLLVLALVLALTTLPTTHAQFQFDASTFEGFMAAGNGTQLNGHESVPELGAKVLTRVIQLAEDLLAHPTHIFSLFDGDQSTQQHSATTFASRSLLADSSPQKTLQEYMDSIQQILHNHQDSLKQSSVNDPEDWKPLGIDPYPFFGFMPLMMGYVVPNGKPIKFEAPCFQENTVIAKVASHDENGLVIDIEMTVGSPTSLFCTDRYWLGTLQGMMLKGVFFHGTHKFQWKLAANANEDYVWDVLNKGIRFMRFVHDPIQLVVDFYETAQLFLQALTHPSPSPATEGRNLYYLREYARIQPPMKKRLIQNVEIDEDEIHSGDFIGIVRLDGLDPMLAWAMGSTTGHTTVLIRDPNENNALYVAESTTKDSYWPTNGMQRTPFKQWMQQARAAGFNLVHAPLDPKYRAKFNVTKAWEWFSTVEGLDYGYHNMLWAWIDTLNDNYPCAPPDFTQCLLWDHMELIFSWADMLVPSIADLLFTEAFNFRLGVENLRAPALFRRATETLQHGQLPMIIEQDSWRYHTTRYGKPAVGESHVCCTFVCKMWKVAGVFDEIDADINCNEFTNWDVYSLQVFDSQRTHDKRPQQCIDADPHNALCQLAGEYTLELNDFNTKPMGHRMAEKCESKTPEYKRSPQC